MDGEREKVLTKPQRRYLEVLARGGHIEKATTKMLHGGRVNRNPDNYSYYLVSPGGTRKLLIGRAKPAVEEMLAQGWLWKSVIDPHRIELSTAGADIRDTTDKFGYRKEG